MLVWSDQDNSFVGYLVVPTFEVFNLLTSNIYFHRYHKSYAQILIRWSVQKGYITIPKSSKPERITENCQVFDFELSEEEMATMVCINYIE